MARDPVCGMEVDEKNNNLTSQHNGQTYYFCAAECKDKFDRNPEQYSRKTA